MAGPGAAAVGGLVVRILPVVREADAVELDGAVHVHAGGVRVAPLRREVRVDETVRRAVGVPPDPVAGRAVDVGAQEGGGAGHPRAA